jgi:hypothetical protein
MDTKLQQSLQGVTSSASSATIVSMRELLDDFVLSRQFIIDENITMLTDKCIGLGFTYDMTNEVFKELIIQHLNATGKQCTQAVLNSLITNSKLLFNTDEFIAKAIEMSQLSDNMNASKNSWSEQNSETDSPTNELASEFSCLNVKAPEYFFPSASSSMLAANSEFNQQSDTNRQLQMFLQHQQHQQQQRANSAANYALKQQQEQMTNYNAKVLQDSYEKSVNRLNDKSNLRPIIIDGNDVGTPTNSSKQVFSFCRIRKVVEFFEKRQHSVYVIMPNWRKEHLLLSPTSLVMPGIQQLQQQTEMDALKDMEDRNVVHFTPSKRVGNKHIKSDDDGTIMQFALQKQAIIVSNDPFKKFLNQSEQLKQVVEERVLMYSFIDDTFMPADDPLGNTNHKYLSNKLLT